MGNVKKLSSIYKVDEAPLYTPNSPINTLHESIADPNSGLTDDGIMNVEFIRSDRRKLNFVYSVLTAAELQYTLNLVQGKAYNLQFSEFGQVTTMQAYTSSVSYDEIKLGLYQNVTFSAIER